MHGPRGAWIYSFENEDLIQKPLRMALKTILRRYNECASREALCLANLPDSGKVVTEGQSFGMRPRIFRGKLM